MMNCVPFSIQSISEKAIRQKNLGQKDKRILLIFLPQIFFAM